MLETDQLNRRTVLLGACVTCAAGAALAACGGPASSPAAPAAPGTPLGSTADIPVGGGKVFSDAGVVVTQPTAGRFVAFSSRCTHQGCQVSGVENGTIDCPCHGSRFAIADGSVVNGPAARSLPAAKVTVNGTAITLA